MSLKLKFACLLLLLVTGPVFAVPPLGVSGTSFYAGRKPIVLKGSEANGAAGALEMIQNAKSTGINFITLNLGSVAQSATPGIPSKQGWAQADSVMAAATKAGVWVMISLASGREEGSMEALSHKLGGKGSGLYYVDGRARDWYVYLLKLAVVRWAKSPALGGWLIGSALQDKDDPQGARAAQWAQEAAAVIRKIDTRHPVGVSWAGQGVPAVARVALIDFLAVPAKDSSAVAAESGKPTLSWDKTEAGAVATSGEQEKQSLQMGAPKVQVVDGQRVRIRFAMAENAVPYVDWGKDGMLDETVEGKPGKTAGIVVSGLKAGQAYLFRPRAVAADGRVASGRLISLRMPALKRRIARRVPPVQNIIRAYKGKFWDGKKIFQYVGANNYYLRYIDDKKIVTDVLDAAQQMGMRVMRVQANGELVSDISKTSEEKLRFFIHGSPRNYYEPTFERYDFILDEAQKRGIRIIIYVTDYWEYYGGIKSYAKWYGSDDKAIFYTDKRIKEDYKALWRKWIGRKNSVNGRMYKDDPTIFCWELMNEPHYEKDKTGKTLAAWTQEMALYVKSLDPRHMVSAGTEGYENENGEHYSGADFATVTAAKGIDFGTIHPYPYNQWRRYSLKAVKQMLKKIVKIAHGDLNKPVIMEEFGVEQKYEDSGELNRFTWTETMAETFLKSGGNGINVWQLIHHGYKGSDGFEFHRDNLEYFNLFSRLADEVNP